MLDGTAAVGPRVLVLDDLNDWRGLGTAVALAEAGHETTIVTAAAVVAGGLFHSAADGPLRARFARAGGRSITDASILAWDRARDACRAPTPSSKLDTLVIAETPCRRRRSPTT